jgi:hypothetical protein
MLHLLRKRTTMNEERETWWVVSGEMLTGILYRAKYGQEEPDMLILELAANANTIEVEDDDG